jgi:hypothetical protein
MTYRRIATLKTADEFRTHLSQSEIDLAFDDVMASGPEAPLAQP